MHESAGLPIIFFKSKKLTKNKIMSLKFIYLKFFQSFGCYFRVANALYMLNIMFYNNRCLFYIFIKLQSLLVWEHFDVQS